MTPDYRYSLDISSQFPFCGIPLRLDTYSSCQFACRYCFASSRGGAASDAKMQLASATSFQRRMVRVATKGAGSALDEFLEARIPIHFGGMSDPFTPLEATHRRTLDFLKILVEHQYPTVISTKGVLAARSEYVELLRSPNFVVQFSITCGRDEDALLIDAGAPPTSSRLAAVRELSSAGVKTAVRMQPLFPTYVPAAPELIARCAEAGAKHLAIEFLKLPIEQDWGHRNRLSEALGVDLSAYYRDHGAQRVGREWVLTVEERLPIILSLRDVSHRLGLSFGAGDTDLLHLSDGSVCCSGADLLGMGPGYRHNFLGAVRSGVGAPEISIQALENEWRPTRSIAQHLNSRSRGGGRLMQDYIRSRWNGVANGPSPLSFYGVMPTGRTDEGGFRIYKMSDEVKALAAQSRPPSI